MQAHDSSTTDGVQTLCVPITDIVEPAEAAFRDAINPAGHWFHQDGHRQESDAPDTDSYLLSGIKLVLTAGQAAVNGAQRYGDALERVRAAVATLATSEDLDKQRKGDVYVQQQEELNIKVRQFRTVATTLGGNFDQLLVRFWELHPINHGRSCEASIWMQ